MASACEMNLVSAEDVYTRMIDLQFPETLALRFKGLLIAFFGYFFG